jgi:S1-C subfamily serine protease
MISTRPATWLALALLMASEQASALTAEQVYAKVSPSVWRIGTYDADNLPLGQGSGVVVGPEDVVTNCHVLAKAKRVAVRQDKTTHDAKLVLWDVKRDLCQLKVAGLKAPAVGIAESAKVAVGQSVFAVGNPKGLDLTLSAGLVSSLRRNDAGQLILIQTTAAISSGSSGGGLFDDEGRLIGLTTLIAAAPDAQNLNFAIPADWVRELPQRHAAAASSSSSSSASTGKGVSDNPAALKRGDQIVYRVTDLFTGVAREAVYTVDRLEAERVVFNRGGRVEQRDGTVVSLNTPLAGEMDNCMPPGGWARRDLGLGASWTIDAVRPVGAPCAGSLSLKARVVAEESMLTALGELKVLRIEYQGTLQSQAAARQGIGMYAVKARAWWAPSLARTIRFEFESRASGSTFPPTRELAELTAIQRE